MENEEVGPRPSESKAILQVIIHCCDKLKSKYLVTHPVVCMHAVDAAHGTYIKKIDRNRAVTSYYEVQRPNIDYIMPIMTQPSEIKGNRNQQLSWEEPFCLNEKYDYFLSEEANTILFFEILDVNPSSHRKRCYQRLNYQNGLQKIAWAFLKVVGSNRIVNTGKHLRLQLYEPYFHQTKSEAANIEVYHWWSKLRKIPLGGSLYITVEPFMPIKVEPKLRSMFPLQQETGKTSADELARAITEHAAPLPKLQESPNSSQKNVHEVKWSRNPGDLCKVPNKLWLSLETGYSCSSIKFSHSGRELAVGCGSEEHHLLFIYEIPSGNLLSKEVCHSDIIYDLDWCRKDKLLLSASGDCNVRVWRLKSWNLVASLTHPAFVYSAKFHPSVEKIIGTSCYDHVVRIWKVDKYVQLLKELEAHRSLVNTLCWDIRGEKLFSADNAGHIMIWKIQINKKEYDDSFMLAKEFCPQEIKGIPVTKIIPHCDRNSFLLLCGDCIARQVDIMSETIVRSYDAFLNSLNLFRGCCSPCGTLLFLCGEQGTVFAWNVSTATITAGLPPASCAGQVSSIDYHPHDHMLAVCFLEENMPICVYGIEPSDAETGPVNCIEKKKSEMLNPVMTKSSKLDGSFIVGKTVESQDFLNKETYGRSGKLDDSTDDLKAIAGSSKRAQRRNLLRNTKEPGT